MANPFHVYIFPTKDYLCNTHSDWLQLSLAASNEIYHFVTTKIWLTLPLVKRHWRRIITLG